MSEHSPSRLEELKYDAALSDTGEDETRWWTLWGYAAKGWIINETDSRLGMGCRRPEVGVPLKITCTPLLLPPSFLDLPRSTTKWGPTVKLP